MVSKTTIGHRTSARAFTLIEAIMYCTLLTLFAGIFFLSLPYSSNASAEDLGRSAELGGITAVRLNAKIANSAEGKIVLQDQGRTLILLNATDERNPQFSYDSTGKILWRQWEYFVLDEGKLRQVLVPLSSPTVKENVGQPRDLAATQVRQGRVFANHVKDFKVVQVTEGYRVVLSLLSAGTSLPIQTLARPRN